MGPALLVLWTAWLNPRRCQARASFPLAGPSLATLPLPSPRFQRCYNRWKCQISRIRDPRPACSRLESWLPATQVRGRVSGRPRRRRRSRSTRIVSIRKFASASRYPERHRASFRIVVCAGDKLASTNITAHSERRGQSGMVLGGPSACRPRIFEELARLMIIPFFFLCRIICYDGIPFATESNISFINNKMESHAESIRRPRRRVGSRTADDQLIIHQSKSDNEEGKYVGRIKR